MNLQKTKTQQMMKLFACAVAYMALDIPVRMTGFLKFGDFIGIKCLLPIVCGILFGIYGAAGCGMAALLANLLFQVKVPDMIFESISCIIMGIGIWLLWHIVEKNGRVHLKSGKQLFLYIGSMLIMSLICGGLGSCIGGRSYFQRVLITNSILGILVGIPLLIMATSIVCVENVAPWFRRKTDDIAFELHKEQDISELNVRLEELGAQKQISMKRLFEIQNCIEELMIRILEKGSSKNITIYINISDSVSLKMQYDGIGYNPIRKTKTDDEDTMIGLKLIRARALRVGYIFRGGKNELHVIL